MKKMFINTLTVFFIFLLVIVGNVQAASTADEIMDGATSFIQDGESDTIRVRNATTGDWEHIPYEAVEESEIKSISDFLYNLFLGVGIIVAVVVGIIIGIKLITGSIEEKAQYKELLLPYLVSCIVIFGAFGIWKIIVSILVNI